MLLQPRISHVIQFQVRGKLLKVKKAGSLRHVVLCVTRSNLSVSNSFEVIKFQKWLIPLHSPAFVCLACAPVESRVSANEKALVRRLRVWGGKIGASLATPSSD